MPTDVFRRGHVAVSDQHAHEDVGMAPGVEIVDEFDTVEDMRKLARQVGALRRKRNNV